MRLLFIAHRIPYPPNKGDKIRSYNELDFLCRRFEVDLVFFHGASEQAHIPKLQGMCRSVHGFRRGPLHQLMRLVEGFLLREPLSVALYRHAGMRRKIARLVAEGSYDHVFVFSGQMAQYLPPGLLARAVIDFCDVDSHKWSNYADRLPFYLSWFYRLEAGRLLRFEKAASLGARASMFITAQELALFRSLGGAGRFVTLGNGVDSGFFRPGGGKYEEGRILFTGAMDYFPNEEGVEWFAREVFVPLKRMRPAARFIVAGSNPSLRVRRLAQIEGVEVTGFVPDIRKEQDRAHVVVVPLRIARGMQNKVLEAMSCGKATVASRKALGGIDAREGVDLEVANSPEEFLAKVDRLLGDPARVESMGDAARRYVLENFSWDRNLNRDLLPLFAAGSSAPAA